MYNIDPINSDCLLCQVGFSSNFRNLHKLYSGTFLLGVVTAHLASDATRTRLVTNGYDTANKLDVRTVRKLWVYSLHWLYYLTCSERNSKNEVETPKDAIFSNARSTNPPPFHLLYCTTAHGCP